MALLSSPANHVRRLWQFAGRIRYLFLLRLFLVCQGRFADHGNMYFINDALYWIITVINMVTNPIAKVNDRDLSLTSPESWLVRGIIPNISSS